MEGLSSLQNRLRKTHYSIKLREALARVQELETAMQRAIDYLEEFEVHHPLHNMDDLIIDDFKRLLSKKQKGDNHSQA